jgi:hypothetical protein
MVADLNLLEKGESVMFGNRTFSSLSAAALFVALPALAVEKSSYYSDLAKRLEAESQVHARMAAEFEKSPTMWEQKFPMSGKTAGHCRWLSEKLARQAAEARAKATKAGYPDEVAKLEAESQEHARMAAEFEKSPTMWEQKFPMSGNTAGHCRWLSEKLARKAAKLRADAAR